MTKIEELNELKKLHDSNVINEFEFNSLKEKILNNKKIEEKAQGFLTITFPGQWFLFDVNVKIYIDGKYISKHSLKQGFSEKIKIEKTNLELKIGLLFKSTLLKIKDLNTNSNYELELEYSDFAGKFSNKYKLKQTN